VTTPVARNPQSRERTSLDISGGAASLPTMPATPARERFLELLHRTVADGTLTKLTLGKPGGAADGPRNLHVRPVALKSGPHLSFVWRHADRDITKNHAPAEALAELERLIGKDFLDAHLFAADVNAQLECRPDGTARLRTMRAADTAAPVGVGHDRAKRHPVPADARWLCELGVTNAQGRPREGMADKLRQVQRFAELLTPLIDEAFPEARPEGAPPLRLVDAGSGKGYLTFALAEVLGVRARIIGIELRPALVELCNRVARDCGWETRLGFVAGGIKEVPTTGCDGLIALHACDTATDDALALGITAGARLLVVAPCCQKELRPQLAPAPVLAPALRHGIFAERHAEFATDALRVLLLEWAGYRARAFEFISGEHTAKNLMIAAVKAREPGDPARAQAARELAAFYGVKHHALAKHLGLDLAVKP
jgi:SAM-dependent methyltransferase